LMVIAATISPSLSLSLNFSARCQGGKMSEIANYTILVNGDFVLDTENLQQDLSFSLPSGVQPAGAVLSFVVNTIKPEFGFEILVNDNAQFTANVPGDAFHSLHEVVGGLQAGPNSIIFRRLGGNFEISGVVLWFQQDI
ncbi:MAG: hypothetical protein ACRER6_18145, partial [Pseudomonas sp.]